MASRPVGDRGRPSRVWLAGALAVFAVVTLDVLLGGPLTVVDRRASAWAQSTGLPGPGWERPLETLLDQFVNFGDVEVVVAILLVVLAVLCWRNRTVVPLARLAMLGLVTIIMVSALKAGIGRPPPSSLVEPAPRSYPSGHTATSVVLWGLLAGLVAEYRLRSVSRRVVEVLSWLGPLLTMIGMLLRDYHWLSDLLGGAALGVVLLQAERLALRHWRGARRGSGSAERAPGGGGPAGGPALGEPGARRTDAGLRGG